MNIKPLFTIWTIIKAIFSPSLFMTISYRKRMKFISDKYNVHINVYKRNADEAFVLLEPKEGEDYIYGPLEDTKQKLNT